MTIRNHLLDDIGPLGSAVNGTLPKIISSDEESGFCVVCLEFGEKISSVVVRSVVESESNVSRRYTAVDTIGVTSNPTVKDIAELRSSNAGSRAA